MKYTIWSIDSTRSSYTDEIKSNFDVPPIPVRCIDGKNDIIKYNEITRHRLERLTRVDLKPGELGVWLTFVNTLKTVVALDENLLVFEDDAILHHNFETELVTRLADLPADFDFFSLFIPRDHDHWVDFVPELDKDGLILNGMSLHEQDVNRVSDLIYRPWQRYGGVSMVWSPEGARKALELIYKHPYQQWDEFVYAQSRLGRLNGYTSNPRLSDLVYISGNETSLTH